MIKLSIILMGAILASSSLAGTFTNKVKDIQVYEDRVRVFIGGGYGTCNERDGWFGWATSNMRHNDWLSLAITAKATNSNISFYDAQNSCAGPVDIVGIEGVFLPEVQ